MFLIDVTYVFFKRTTAKIRHLKLMRQKQSQLIGRGKRKKKTKAAAAVVAVVMVMVVPLPAAAAAVERKNSQMRSGPALTKMLKG